MARHNKSDFNGGVAVAIPVFNEVALIGRCLQGLAQQTFVEPFEVVLLLNNCSDGTETVVHRLAPELPFRLHIHDYWLEPSLVNAGIARRMAMQHAASFVRPDGVLFTTDADSVVPSNWIAASLAHIKAGCDAVAGRTQMDPVDEARLPAHLGAEEACVMTYAALLDEIDFHLDPSSYDPWPRHTEHSGASIAVRAACHGEVGGIPNIASGEDREFFQRLRKIDCKIRHAPEIVVTVSGRLVGRATGGMADTMARRIHQQDIWLDEDLETASRRAKRADLRAAIATARHQGAPRDEIERLAGALRVPAGLVENAILAPCFGAGWADIERQSPVLMRMPMLLAALPAETEKARCLLRELRRKASAASGPTYPDDIAALSSAGLASRLAASPE